MNASVSSLNGSQVVAVAAEGAAAAATAAGARDTGEWGHPAAAAAAALGGGGCGNSLTLALLGRRLVLGTGGFDLLFRALSPWQIYLLSSATNFERLYGKRADKVKKLYNGMIPCFLYQYFKQDKKGL